MRTVRTTAVALAACVSLIGVGGLSACGNSSDSSSSGKKPEYITVWDYEESSTGMGKAWAAARADFTKQTGIKVRYQKKAFEQIRQNASQILNSDKAPDVMEYNKGNATAGLLASQGLLSSLNSYVSKYKWNTKIHGALATTARYNEKGVMGSGDWYGIPTYGEDVIMYYNKDLFDKYGIEIPKTFDELTAAMDKFKQNGVTPLSEGVAEYPLQHLWWQLVLSKASQKFLNSYEMYKGKVNWNDPALTFATDTIDDWVKKGYISKDSTGLKAEDAGQNFIKGENPMFFSGSWWFGRFQNEIKNMNWTSGLFPDAKKIPGSSGNIFVIPEKSTKKDYAAQFINLTLQPKYQNMMGNNGAVPVAAEASAIKNPQTRQLIADYNKAVKDDMLGLYPDWPTPTFYDDLNSALQELVNGTATTKQFLSELHSKYDKGVEDAGVTQ